MLFTWIILFCLSILYEYILYNITALKRMNTCLLQIKIINIFAKVYLKSHNLWLK